MAFRVSGKPFFIEYETSKLPLALATFPPLKMGLKPNAAWFSFRLLKQTAINSLTGKGDKELLSF